MRQCLGAHFDDLAARLFDLLNRLEDVWILSEPDLHRLIERQITGDRPPDRRLLDSDRLGSDHGGRNKDRNKGAKFHLERQ